MMQSPVIVMSECFGDIRVSQRPWELTRRLAQMGRSALSCVAASVHHPGVHLGTHNRDCVLFGRENEQTDTKQERTQGRKAQLSNIQAAKVPP